MKRAFSRKNLWENSPAWVKRGVGAALAVVPPALLLGRSFRQTLKEARESRAWSPERVRSVQLERVREICTLAAERSEFYRDSMARAGFDPRGMTSLVELHRLPLIDKSVIRAHAEAMCVVPPSSPGVDEVSTGGSSGEPFRFFIGAGRSAVEFAYLTAGWERVGYRFGDVTAVFRGQVVEARGDAMRHSYDPLLRRHYYSNFHMGDDEMRRYLEHVAGLGPCFVLAYPSSADALARFIERGGHPPMRNVRAVLSGSEMTYPGQRERCERAFGCRYFTWYGHSEKLVLAAECEHSTDYHIWPGYGYCELVDEQGRPVTEAGVVGEIVGTGFINRVMPFIRYRTGDWATYVGDRCEACGFAGMLIRDIQGHRTQEMLVAADGTRISWVALNMHDDTFEGVRQFQFRQERAGEAELKLVAGPELDDAGVARILRNLDRKFDGRMKIVVRRVAEIPLTPRGKTVYVDQQMKLDGPPAAGPVPEAEEVRA
jgi:phenylacetate-CoA ligase